MLLRLLLGFALACQMVVCAAACPSLGAIRWDAWHGAENGPVGRIVERSLSPGEFRSRAPFCAAIRGERIEINCAGKDVLRQEAQYAVEGGLDYWAFLTHPFGDPMSLALQDYLQSETRNPIKFSLILTPNALASPVDSLKDNLERFAQYVTRQDYQVVMGGRPLVFFFPAGRFLSKQENIQWLAAAMNDFRVIVKARDKDEPYLVLMEFNPAQGRSVALKAGFDAISTYATHGNRKAAPYKVLAAEARNFWERAKATGAKVVPTVMSGWDRRPRVVNPVPWERGRTEKTHEIEYYYQPPAPAELADHIGEAISWVNANSTVVDANTILIYAWNENDEGGWLIPTLGEKDARLRAIRNKRNQMCGR